MQQFVTLPSGLTVNLDTVRRVTPTGASKATTLTLYFSADDATALNAEDSAALRARLGTPGTFSKMALLGFFLVIIAAVLLFYLATRHA